MDATAALLKLVERIQESRDFEELLLMITGALRPIRGIGELYLYDCAQRIGAAIGRHPDLVYLHRGTREGAAALGIDVRGRRSLLVSEMPEELQVLSPTALEDLLCIFKVEIESIMNNPLSSNEMKIGRS